MSNLTIYLRDNRLQKYSAAFIVLAAILLRAFFMHMSLTHLPVTTDEAMSVLAAKRIWGGEWLLLLPGIPYFFPFESYLLSPLVDWMPRNAVGARYLPFMLGSISVIGFLYIARRSLQKDSQWLAYVCILVPSTYVLMYQSAYIPTNYAVTMTFAWIVVLLFDICQKHARPNFLIFVVGLLGGLAFSTHILSIAYVFPAFLFLCLGGNISYIGVRTVCLSTGAVIGLLPFLSSLIIYPKAYHAVSELIPLNKILYKLWNPGLTETLPGVLGINPTLFPDFDVYLNQPHFLRTTITYVYLAILILVIANRAMLFVQRVRLRHWPSFGVHDLFVTATIIAIVLYAMNMRAQSETYRYLLIPALYFPFLLAYAYSISKFHIRVAIGMFTIFLLLFNMTTSARIIRIWGLPHFPGEIAKTPPITELIEILKRDSIDRCYATFWLAYRITYETDEAIICSAPYNERFLGWPEPYKQLVDQSQKAPYVLSTGFDTRLPIATFEQHMAKYNVSYEKRKVGAFTLYENFLHKPSTHDITVATTDYTLSGSHNASALSNLSDSNENSVWNSGISQQTGMWLQADFKDKIEIQRVTLVYPFPYPRIPDDYAAKTIRIYGNIDNSWTILADNIEHQFDRIRVKNGRPIYGGAHQTIWFNPVLVNAIKVEIIVPRAGKTWNLGTLEFGAHSVKPRQSQEKMRSDQNGPYFKPNTLLSRLVPE
ncbi:MAG TPA: hypothetical protein ENI80_11505 [Acidiferrobacteraceae bacterium]|nr:hypothetical protein [Acidiferrobacteraceae bacterium]